MSFAPATETFQLFLNKVQVRSPLSAEEQEAVLRLPARPRQIAAHGEIVRLGEQVSHSCLVASGLVSRFSQMEDGRRQHISFHIAGDMVDLYSLMLPAAPSALVALTATTIFEIPHTALSELAFRFPALAAAFWRECVIDGNIVAQWLVSAGRRDARGRLAHLLCEMAVRSAQIGKYVDGSFPFPITQEQISDALGLTSVHVNRSIKALREEGLIQTSRGMVTIIDWEALSFAGEFDPAYLHLPPLPRTAVRAVTV
ncbi:Crp/Fnr family transcriptional regulator [Sphingobium sp. DC-2]|uniref:Crp/Fnr family transcriptional regulator n=1 Tax=Sphingobium sp. DC-2 TaxID=1303256 RepID=UPI0004C2C242|nr:Crp/Fnr family transcriptional regulator [Sphingobium sp. DC-2]